MYLVDSSAWIEYLRRTGSRADLQVTELVEQPSPAAGVTEPVIMLPVVDAPITTPVGVPPP